MKDDAISVQQPAAGARHLVLLFHGVGASPETMLPLAKAVSASDPAAWVVSVRSPDESDFGMGWQWFSVRGITEENRVERVAAAMPAFVQTIEKWNKVSGLGVEATSLIGFSQGAIMALESTQLAAPPAAQVISIAGRFAVPPRVRPPATAVHLIHGSDDSVIDPRHSIAAADRLSSMGTRVHLNLLPDVAHTIDQKVIDLVCATLREAWKNE